MSTNIKPMMQQENVPQDKHNDDDVDDWDDWGDAEDNLTLEDKPITTTTNITTETVVKQANKENIKNINNHVESTSSCKEQQQELLQPATSSSWWGGFTSVLSTATEGIGNITSTVSQGLNQVIGVPDPEELARQNAAEAAAVKKSKTPDEKPANDDVEHEDDSATAFGKNLVSGVTNLGSKVLYTGLDTLEGIGKKTMNILQENDPLLKNKRKLLGLEPERPNLSDVLKEAKKDAEEIENTLKELKIAHNQQKMQFEPLFEQKCGLVHLEALDILAKESELKLKSLMDSVSGKALKDLQETVHEVEELMEPEETEVDSDGEYTAAELKEKLMITIEDLDIPIHFDELVSNWQQTLDWWSTNEESSAQAIYEQGIVTLAECCALAINKLHKIAELLLVKEHHSTASEVDSIVQLCLQFNVHLHGVTHRFASKLSAMNDNNDDAKKLLNTLCGELLMAVQQIDRAFKLFLPIIQIGAA